MLCATVLKRLSSKRVLAPHAGTTISFNPQPAHPNTPQHTPHRQGKEASGTQQQDQPQQQQQQQRYEFQTDLLMLVAGNSRQMGRTVAVCPDALLDDGLIDFTLLSGSSLAAQVGAGAVLAACCCCYQLLVVLVTGSSCSSDVKGSSAVLLRPNSMMLALRGVADSVPAVTGCWVSVHSHQARGLSQLQA